MSDPRDGSYQCEVCPQRTPLNETDTCCWRCGAGKEHIIQVLTPEKDEERKIQESIDKYVNYAKGYGMEEEKARRDAEALYRPKSQPQSQPQPTSSLPPVFAWRTGQTITIHNGGKDPIEIPQPRPIGWNEVRYWDGREWLYIEVR